MVLVLLVLVAGLVGGVSVSVDAGVGGVGADVGFGVGSGVGVIGGYSCFFSADIGLCVCGVGKG